MADPTGATARLTTLLRRLADRASAGQRRQAELVRRDDVAHHLLVTLHDRVNGLHHRVDGLDAALAAVNSRIDALTDTEIRLGETTHRAVDAANLARGAADDVATDVALLAVHTAALGAPEPTDEVLVSIVLPTWQRAALVGEAIASVQAQTHRRWELLVVDDGSDDGTDEVVGGFLDDERIRFLPIAHDGVSAARNRALSEATGDVVAYLDSDNTWHPTHLARLVHALTSTGATWAHSGQVVFDARHGRARIRKDLRSIDGLLDGNFVDMNTVAHLRSALDRTGLFDTELTRLVDWDFVLRLAGLGAPARTGAVTSLYREDLADRISEREPLHVQMHRVRARHRGLPAEGLRILFAEWHYLQITETYIASLAHALVALGAEVQVWADVDPSVPSEVPLVVHRGALEDVIAEFQPDLVVTNWLNKGTDYRPAVRAAGLPHVVRAHGFDQSVDLVRGLLAEDDVLVHTFPHLVDPEFAGHPRLVPEVSGFDDELYSPSASKDRQLVMRTSAGLFTKDIDTFLVAATLCPDHRFLLVLGHSLYVEERTEAIVARAQELGSPCEIRFDLLHDEMARLMGRVGIYLHTHGTDHVVGMPISIAEAMATGAYVIARDLPGIAEYVGDAGDLYDGATVEERAERAAALVRATGGWTPERWAQAEQRSIDRAYRLHAGSDVAARMLTSWRATFPQLDR